MFNFAVVDVLFFCLFFLKSKHLHINFKRGKQFPFKNTDNINGFKEWLAILLHDYFKSVMVVCI